MARKVSSRSKVKCNFCGLSIKNKYKYGDFYKVGDIFAHYFCVLLSTELLQRGKDSEGICGFLLSDIKKQLKAKQRVKCYFCDGGRATVYCQAPGCRRVFHFPCALRAGSLPRFSGHFPSFCHEHRPRQPIPEKILTEAYNCEIICSICFERVNCRDKINTLWAPCCSRTWYHRNCIQTLAYSAGYFFRCANCNDSEKFAEFMRNFGVYIPQQDASWELVPNAYEELLFKYNNCDAEKCQCPHGRQKNVDDSKWKIVLCNSCGSQGIHLMCGNVEGSFWECDGCKRITCKISDTSETSQNRELPNHSIIVSRKRSCPFENSENSALDKRKKRKKIENATQKTDSEKPDVDSVDDKFHIEAEGVETDESEDIDVVTVDKNPMITNPNFQQVISNIKPGPLSYKMSVMRTLIKDTSSSEELAEKLQQLSDPDSNAEVIDITSSDEEGPDITEIENDKTEERKRLVTIIDLTDNADDDVIEIVSEEKSCESECLVLV